MKIRYQLAASAVALSICSFSSAAFAQSTGSVDFDEEIVVTGSLAADVGGVQIPDTPKSKSVLTDEYIQRQNPGQTVLDTINSIPGVTFTNNDAYGSSGGSLNIRGFGGDRISLTFDGVPLNDTGNYAIYSNQQLDPELIQQVNVNLGSTDVDSPTASAVGGTVNYRTRRPSEDFSVRFAASAGQFDFKRFFAIVDTGNLNASGSRFFISASNAKNDNPFNNYGKVDKQQYNASFFQPIGENGDFVQVSAHYNQNRNNFFGSVALREDTSGNRVVPSRFPLTVDEREYNINFPCTTTVPARPNLADAATRCGTEFDRRFNPSNTGNVRIKSKFSLTDTLTLTVDPSFQSVKANGGGTVNARERLEGGRTGYIGGRPYFGRDLNGDGDLLDEVAILAPSNTRTQRFGVISNLRFDMSDTQSIQVSYTFDRGRHRQTGELGLLDTAGTPEDVFNNTGLTDAAGNVLQKRDRKSIATLHQASGRYNGKFMEEKLLLDIGVRLPFFTRDLTQNCFTTSASGFVDCFGSNTLNASYAASFPTRQGPQNREFNYNKLLPNVGFTYKLVDNVSLFGSYAQGLSVPGTDPLYSSFFFVPGAGVKPAPETTDSFDGGLRYRSGPVQAMVSGWFTKYNNRLQTVFDVETNESIFTNIGKVDVYGLDASIAFQPVDFFNVYAFGSLNESEIKDNVKRSATQTVPLAGKKLNDTPNYSFGVGSQINLGPVSIGGVAKRTGGRYIYDTNLPVYASAPDYSRLGVDPAYAAPAIVFGAKKPAYWMVNLDARVNLEFLGLNDKTFFQLNVYNLFDELYVGSRGGATFQSGGPGFAQIGAPRTVSGTFNFQF